MRLVRRRGSWRPHKSSVSPLYPPSRALIPYFLLSLSCQSKRYASSYSLAGKLSFFLSLLLSLSLSPPPLTFYPSFSLEHALLRNNEGIYFINTGYPPRGIVLSNGEGKWEKTSGGGESEGVTQKSYGRRD